MATAIEDDEFDDEPVAAPKIGASSAADKLLSTEEERMRADLARVQERKLGIIMGATLMVIVSFFLGMIGYALFFGPPPEFSFTPATHRDLTTPNDTSRNNDTVPLPPSGGLQHEYAEGSLTDEESEGSAADAAKLFCATPECQAHVRFLEDQLDPNHDACGNLYDHVCARWQKRHEKLASENGRATVDELIAAGHQDRLVALLLDKENDSFGRVRNLFQDCLSGRLATDKDVAGILDAVMAATSEDSSAQAVAEIIAHMAALGVSPFFDVAANVTNDTVYVKLLPRRRLDEERSGLDDDGERDWTNLSSKHEKESTFMDSLRRQLCLEIKRMARPTKNCVLTLASDITFPWKGGWLQKNGQDRLFKSAMGTLQPFLALKKELYAVVEDDKPRSLSAIKERSRCLQACLSLIRVYDSAGLSFIEASALPPTLQREAKEILHVLNESLVEAFPSAPPITFKLGQPPMTTLMKQAHRPKGTTDHVGEDMSATGDSKLKTFLRAAAWDKWTSHRVGSPVIAFSTMPTSPKESYVVYVSPTVFNMTGTQDPHLQHLRLARIGPRVLNTVFRSRLATALNGSRASNCISRLRKGRPVGSGKRVNLDVEEVAAFYVALMAYRRKVGEALPISGSPLNSDSLFLLHYALNKCEVVSADYETIRQTPSASVGRSQVESVSAAFRGVLLEQCQNPLHPPSCDADDP